MNNIRRISSLETMPSYAGNALVVVGSFAPVHDGHFDAVRAAGKALEERGSAVHSVVMAPNSDEYLYRKLQHEAGDWSFERRVQKILARETPFGDTPTYVDDISGAYVGLNEINQEVPVTLRRVMGLTADRLFFVTGSDQIRSMEAHLAHSANRAICVMRPDGGLSTASQELSQEWAVQAIEEGRYIITDRENMETDISSTAVRRNASISYV